MIFPPVGFLRFDSRQSPVWCGLKLLMITSNKLSPHHPALCLGYNVVDLIKGRCLGWYNGNLIYLVKQQSSPSSWDFSEQ